MACPMELMEGVEYSRGCSRHERWSPRHNSMSDRGVFAAAPVGRRHPGMLARRVGPEYLMHLWAFPWGLRDRTLPKPEGQRRSPRPGGSVRVWRASHVCYWPVRALTPLACLAGRKQVGRFSRPRPTNPHFRPTRICL